MKKRLLISIAFLSAALSSYGQVFSENFSNLNGSLPAGWTMIDVDGNTPNASVANFTTAWIIAGDFDNPADTVAMSNSWYTPAGTSNDWLITPSISLTANNLLSWQAESQDVNYLESYEVRICTAATPTVANFLANPPLFSTTAQPGAVWTTHNVNLQTAGYSNQNVFLAWRNTSTDEFVIMIDDISIVSLASADAAMANNGAAEYTKTPLPQVSAPLNYSGTISNVGSGPITNVQMKVNVLNGAMANVYTNTSVAVPTIAAGANALFAFSGFTPTIADNYTVQLICLINEADGVGSNDTVSYLVEYTDTVFARDNGIMTGTLGIGAGTAGELGQNFTLANADTLTSVSFLIGNANGIMVGQPVFARIYNTDASGTPTTLITTTETLIINNSLDSLWTAVVTGGSTILPAGTYTITVDEADSNITIGTTNQIFTPGKTWVRFATTPWSNNEAFGFNVSYILRANFGNAVCVASSAQSTVSNCSSYTSPSGNYTWTTTGTYADTVMNVAGCDSIITVNLTILNQTTSTITQTNCGPYTSPSGNYTWTTSGTYADTVMNAAGCDSVITVNLTVSAVNNAVALSGTTITAAAAGATYQWIDCNNANMPIAGATGQSYTATANGSYAVIVTQGNCSDTSVCTTIANIGLEELGIYDFTVFPNPSNGQFKVELISTQKGSIVISILSADGKLVQSQETELSANKNAIQIDAKRLPSGYYFVKVENSTGAVIRSIAIQK